MFILNLQGCNKCCNRKTLSPHALGLCLEMHKKSWTGLYPSLVDVMSDVPFYNDKEIPLDKCTFHPNPHDKSLQNLLMITELGNTKKNK